MKNLKFQKKNAEKYLIASGYEIGKDGSMISGYVYETPKGRFHAKVKGNWIDLHFDLLVNKMHKVLSNVKMLSAEKHRILDKEPQFSQIHHVVKNDFCYYCTLCHEAHGDGDGFIGKECKLS